MCPDAWRMRCFHTFYAPWGKPMGCPILAHGIFGKRNKTKTTGKTRGNLPVTIITAKLSLRWTYPIIYPNIATRPSPWPQQENAFFMLRRRFCWVCKRNWEFVSLKIERYFQNISWNGGRDGRGVQFLKSLCETVVASIGWRWTLRVSQEVGRFWRSPTGKT